MELPKLPYRAEYAKSGRAQCKGCKDIIAKDSLRLAVMVQSPFFDGMQPNWFHFSCFFKRHRPKDVLDISHYDTLRWNDQQLIKAELEKYLSNPTTSSTSTNGKSSGSKKRKNAAESGVPDIADYTVEYAKSNRSKCKVCEEFINKDEVRISKKDYENEIAMQYGPTERWHHVNCFIKAREELKFFASAQVLPGFEDLESEDQKMLKKKIPKIDKSDKNDVTDGPSPPKKSKEGEANEKKLKSQTEKMFKYRDALEMLEKSELVTLFEFNNQDVPVGVPRMLDYLSDAMVFGALKRCETCKGQLVFCTGLGYKCRGDVSEWSRCQAVYSDPARVVFKVPGELKDKYNFLKKYRGTVSKREFVQTTFPDKISSKEPEQTKSILEAVKFFIHKTESKASGDVKKQIESLGGVVVSKWEEDVLAVISTNAEVQKPKLSKNLKSAKNLEIHVVPDSFFDDVTSSTSKTELVNKLNEKKISPWGADPTDRIKESNTSTNKSVYPSKSVYPKKEIFKSNQTVQKVTVKGGLAVDPDSGLEKLAHVYCRGSDIYSVVLSSTDVLEGRNSYYKLQILESDKSKKYWLFRAWGRIGTTIGGNKVEKYGSLDPCIEQFMLLFEEKTGNNWEMRKHFQKQPNKMMMLDIECNNQRAEDNFTPALESKILSKPVQDLINLIFDMEAMKRTMLEFEVARMFLDLVKMPLGKLSQKQIQDAFGILSELQNFVNSASQNQNFIEKTNMFYTLVPHDFGLRKPTLLDNEEIIKQKIEMLHSLMEIEIAYNMIKDCKSADIDEYYKQLNAEITELDQDTEEFKTIQLYVKNTHAKTHSSYTLEIEHVFKVERKNEDKRFKKFKKLSNRKLLWHGSRITNFAGILSQGLRIAPPEAPVTGYMFGKGIYFSDMVSKSANYCHTSKENPTGLLLLCEVALGEMLELTKAENIKKLPTGKDSVKGVGKTTPDPKEKVVLPTGTEVPLGKGVDAKIKSSSLLYNEYIVYNVAQVKIQYLVRLKFNHKY